MKEDSPSIPRNRPCASRLVASWAETAVTTIRGTASPLARKASANWDPVALMSGDGTHHGPAALPACHHAQAVVVKDRRRQILVEERLGQSSDHQLVLSLTQAVDQRRRGRLLDVKVEAAVLGGQSLDDGRDEPGRHDLAASDPQLACRGIGEELDFTHARSEIIKDRQAPLEQCAAIER